MSRIFLLLFVVTTFGACALKKQEPFPSQVISAKTPNHIRVEGTKIFAVFPAAYKHVKELTRYQKSDRQYIQVIEADDKSFLTAKPNLTREAIEAKGAVVT